jgi:hypothetical protein
VGTSFSDPSPRTLLWRAVQAGYRDPAVGVPRVVRELWRAAQGEVDANWRTLLSAPLVAACLRIAMTADNPTRAASLASREIARSRQSSLAAEIARRAVVQSFGSADRASRFAEAVFGEASAYLVSRDLAGFVGRNTRNRTVGDAIAFKQQIRRHVADVVRGSNPPQAGVTADRWAQFVGTAVDRLAQRP